jgi:hypothetical protein
VSFSIIEYNVKFFYVHCDGGLANPDQIELSEIETLIRSKLIWGEWFYAEDWKLPELFLPTFSFKIDPTWHEFESIEYTGEAANSPINLADFMKMVSSTKCFI